ncbi:MAG: hypothetical protein JEZ11_09580 [Desulfobacterales bacterium]|nr:hypothetical protein [Desulfobacterales bacterium]
MKPIQPTDSTFYTPTMARIHRDQGHFGKAETIYRYLLEQTPGNEAYQAALEEIAVLGRRQAPERLVALLGRWIDLVLTRQRLAGLGCLENMTNRKSR